MSETKIDPSAHRKDYKRGEFDERSAAADPLEQFARWFADARAAVPIEPNAMTLATATKDGLPSARIVLLKDFDAAGFVFFTNYGSRKGSELNANPHAALLFYWAELERQVRIEGTVMRVSEQASEEYFRARPRGAQLGAVVSRQSTPIDSRATLESAVAVIESTLGGGPVQRPAHWGGYRLAPQRFEFWQGRSDRLHDRLQYEKHEASWAISRLAP